MNQSRQRCLRGAQPVPQRSVSVSQRCVVPQKCLCLRGACASEACAQECAQMDKRDDRSCLEILVQEKVAPLNEMSTRVFLKLFFDTGKYLKPNSEQLAYPHQWAHGPAGPRAHGPVIKCRLTEPEQNCQTQFPAMASSLFPCSYSCSTAPAS